MSLTLSLNNALSGLRVSQQSLAVLSQNIANANNTDYTRQQVSQSALNLGGEFGSGVELAGVSRSVDDFIGKSTIIRSSDVARANIVSQVYGQLQLYVGQPGQSNSIDSYINGFFNSISELSITPERSSLKLAAVSAGSTLANQVSDLATNIQELRFSSDQQIKQSVDTINSELRKIYDLNRAIANAGSTGQSVNSFKDAVEASLKKIANEVDISYSMSAEGTFSISTAGGLSLLDSSLSELEYSPATSAEDFNAGISSKPILIHVLDKDGNRTGATSQLVSGGFEKTVTTQLSGGRLKGLLEMRDHNLPDVLSQVNQLAVSLRDTINKIHNDGVAFPPPQSLSGGTLVNPSQSQYWQGSVMIAALNSDGTPVMSPYPSEQANNVGMAPLTLDLGSLDDGAGVGKPSFQAIIDEINQYYGAPQPKVRMPGLSDVQLVSRSDNLAGGTGTFNFDLNLSNLGSTLTNVRVLGATISSGTLTSPASFPSGSLSVSPGETKASTGAINFSADMSTAGSGPYTISVNVETTDPEGNVSTATLTYSVPEAATAMRNDKFTATSASGAATIESPVLTQPLMKAMLVDENGLEVAKDPLTGDYTQAGYLKLVGSSTNVRVGISELNSSHKGDILARPAIASTNKGFSNYFGLNNFFEDSGKLGGAAVNLKVRDEILSNPQAIALGKLKPSVSDANSAVTKFTYEVGSGSNQIITQLADLAQGSQTFKGAGSLPEVSLTFSGYAAEILGFLASETSQAKDILKQQELIQQGFVDKNNAIRGVNIDEEMANTIIFQNAYSANARVISVTKELFTQLLDAF